MDISKYTVEDFVLDSEFKTWIFSPNLGSNAYWEKCFKENPSQIKNAKIAKEILLNISYSNFQISEEESLEMWDEIESGITRLGSRETKKGKLVLLNSDSILTRYEIQPRRKSWFNQELRVACILIFTFGLSLIYGLITKKEPVVEELTAELVYEEYSAPPGVKSTLTMHDGSIVMLNSGSSIRFVKNFEENRRVVYLEGEAYFEVSKDTLRPFSVISNGVKTTALGTSFNISSYPNEDFNIALLEGKVLVDIEKSNSDSVFLEKGESVKVDLESGFFKKGKFDSELVLAWTKKKIIFQRVKLAEAIRILENWYGVKFIFQNSPSPDLVLYGVFQDETLENVLDGLSYSARFNYKINQDEVKIIFN